MATTLSFCKYQGLGNDFLVLNCSATAATRPSPAQVRYMCDRHFGVGADGVIIYRELSTHEYEMIIMNSDGTEAEMCGNGIRCLARHLCSIGSPRSLDIKTKAGIIRTKVINESDVSVDMGAPRLQAHLIPTHLSPDSRGMVVERGVEVGDTVYHVTMVSMGNPHAVIFLERKMEGMVQIDILGRSICCNEVFPQGANVEFVEIISRNHARMWVWERGSGRTLACGTGACAVVVAGVLTGRLDKSCVVSLEGGDLSIEWVQETPDISNSDVHANDPLNHNRCPVIMTGPAKLVFRGSVDVPSTFSAISSAQSSSTDLNDLV